MKIKTLDLSVATFQKSAVLSRNELRNVLGGSKSCIRYDTNGPNPGSFDTLSAAIAACDNGCTSVTQVNICS